MMKINLKTKNSNTQLDNGRIGFAFCNGYQNWSMPNTDNSYATWTKAADFIQCTGFTYDKDGYSYGTCAGGESNGRQVDAYVFLTSRWGTSVTETGKNSNTSL